MPSFPFWNIEDNIYFQPMFHVHTLVSSVCLTKTSIMRWKYYTLLVSFLGWMNVLFLRTKFLKCVQMMFAFLTFINLYSPLWTETLPAFFSPAMMNFKLKFVPPSFLIWCSFYLWYAFTCHEAGSICISTTDMWYAKLNLACASTHNEFYYHVPSASCAHLIATNGTDHHFIAIVARLELLTGKVMTAHMP